jgi:hypothetical protein
MRTFYIIVVGTLIVVFGATLFPTMRLMTGYVDTTGFPPLLKAAVTFTPYAFLLFVVYAINWMRNHAP